MKKMKFLLVAGLADSLIKFRGSLIEAILSEGFEVHVAAPDMPKDCLVRKRLLEMGAHVHQIPLKRTGTSLSHDLWTLINLWVLMVRLKPSYVLGYTIKPVIYGSLAAYFSGASRCFALITGLGYAFQGDGRRGMLRNLVQRLYAIALARVDKVFFQNPDDRDLFYDLRILGKKTPSCIVNGSGVDISSYAVVPFPKEPLRFLLIARLLGDKGVREYVQAAKSVKKIYPDVQFDIVGWIDTNPDSVKQYELDEWVKDGAIRFLGRLDDVRPAIENCSVYVLPSYREGTPRTVLEAMAMGRPVITTDAPGCRETVVNEENGFLVEVKSASALQKAMLRFIEEPSLVSKMGANARRVAEEKYDVRKVNAIMLEEMGVVEKR